MTLQEFFTQHPKVALAFSGGTDSSFLLWQAKQLGCDIHAYYVNTAFQPKFELEHALQLAKQLDVPLTVVQADVLSVKKAAENPADRCYHCKQALFTLLWQKAHADQHTILIDGTNASDDAGDRPGMKALQELKVLSPLRECGITKQQVRELSRKAGLFTWNKPSYACLATRIPTGTAITLETLQLVEQAESCLSALGFLDFRVRLNQQGCYIQITEQQLDLLLQHRQTILDSLPSQLRPITLDLQFRTPSI